MARKFGNGAPNARKAGGLLDREQRRAKEDPRANEYNGPECLTDHGDDSSYTRQSRLLEGFLQMSDRENEAQQLFNGQMRPDELIFRDTPHDNSPSFQNVIRFIVSA